MDARVWIEREGDELTLENIGEGKLGAAGGFPNKKGSLGGGLGIVLCGTGIGEELLNCARILGADSFIMVFIRFD